MPSLYTSREKSVEIFKRMQNDICTALEKADGTGHFNDDLWNRIDSTGTEGGGGLTRVMTQGALFEKAGVNFSEVHGVLPVEMSKTLIGSSQEAPFYAAGTSLVIHPHSPLVPTIHANVRYLEVHEKAWFGGGIDLTPSYLFEEDAISFHRGLKEICDRNNPNYYPQFKKQCDEYFYIAHRKETRGIGGIFFDYLGREDPSKLDEYSTFAYDVAAGFNELYVPIVERRKNIPWNDEQKRFQLIRRGRYVEFNLVYDRGTLFGLKTNGRVESILMSLPQHASWEYDYNPEIGSEEAKLMDVVRTPRDWI